MDTGIALLSSGSRHQPLLASLRIPICCTALPTWKTLIGYHVCPAERGRKKWISRKLYETPRQNTPRVRSSFVSRRLCRPEKFTRNHLSYAGVHIEQSSDVCVVRDCRWSNPIVSARLVDRIFLTLNMSIWPKI